VNCRRITVFCGSSGGARPAYAEAARSLGRDLAQRGIGLVYGGGCVGLMGGLLDVDGYFDGLRALLERAQEEGFLGTTSRESLVHGTRLEDLLAAFAAHRAAAAKQWIDEASN